MVEAGDVELVRSSVLQYENSRNPFSVRRQWVSRCLDLAGQYQKVDKGIRERGQELEKEGLKAIDALHLACAEVTGSEYFLTCDERVLRRYPGEIKVLNPVDFVLAMTGEQP
jgi:predicted nucleic acid-binding protein